MSRYWEKVIEHKIRFDILYKVCLKHLSFWGEFSETLSQMYIGLHVKNPLFLPELNETCIFSTDFRKIFLQSNSMETRPVEAELLLGDCRIDTQASKQTDRHD